jgi:hypothetical protein
MSLIYAYFFNRSGGALFTAICIHSMINDSLGLRGSFVPDGSVYAMHCETLELALFAIVLITAGLAVVLMTRGRLGYGPYGENSFNEPGGHRASSGSAVPD